MELREYQAIDAQRIKNSTALGLFSEQRTGKTPTAIVGMTQSCAHILVVCPASLMYDWAEAVQVWTQRSVWLCNTKDLPENWKDISVFIVNYEKIPDTRKAKGMWSTLAKMKFDGIILDEAHRIKNRKSLTAKAIYRLSNRIPKHLALTGTPAYDKPEDLWSILHFLDHQKFGSYWEFIQQWCNMEYKWTPSGGTHEPKGIKESCKPMFTKMLNDMCIMHKRTEVMDWNTMQDVLDIKLPLTSVQSKYLTQLSDYFECTDGATLLECQTILDRLIRYRQICTAPAICGLNGKSPKTDWILQFLKDYPDQSVLIFSNSRKYLTYLNVKLPKTLKRAHIDSTVSRNQRAEVVKQFQNHELRVLLLQTQAAKEGLTLDEADSTIFCDIYPPASDYMQAKDRAVPATKEKEKPRTIYRLMMANSYDEQLYQLVDNNIQLTDVINNFITYIKEE